jgi:hypothetical protein
MKFGHKQNAVFSIKSKEKGTHVQNCPSVLTDKIEQTKYSTYFGAVMNVNRT